MRCQIHLSCLEDTKYQTEIDNLKKILNLFLKLIYSLNFLTKKTPGPEDFTGKVY